MEARRKRTKNIKRSITKSIIRSTIKSDHRLRTLRILPVPMKVMRLLITGNVIKGQEAETDIVVLGLGPMIVNVTGGMTHVIGDIDKILVREEGENPETGLM